MRSVSLFAAFTLAATFSVAAPSVAGSAQTGLPGIGTFAYSGSPVTAPAPAVVVAGLTHADRS